MLRDAEADLAAFADFPHAHWRKIWSTNLVNGTAQPRGQARRTDVVGVFPNTDPNTDALLRPAACVLIEAHDEWQDSGRRYLSEEFIALLNPPAPTAIEPPPGRPERGDGPARTTDGIVTRGSGGPALLQTPAETRCRSSPTPLHDEEP